MTRTTCDQIITVHPLNRASSEKSARGAIISEISEALRAFSEFDCLWRAPTRVKLLFTLHTRLVDVLKSRGNTAPEVRTAMQQVVDGS